VSLLQPPYIGKALRQTGRHLVVMSLPFSTRIERGTALQ
jgi:hypothetical protein